MMNVELYEIWNQPDVMTIVKTSEMIALRPKATCKPVWSMINDQPSQKPPTQDLKLKTL